MNSNDGTPAIGLEAEIMRMLEGWDHENRASYCDDCDDNNFDYAPEMVEISESSDSDFSTESDVTEYFEAEGDWDMLQLLDEIEDSDSLYENDDFDSVETETDCNESLLVNDIALDHIIVGVSDFDNALDQIEAMTGILPVEVVQYDGLGIKSARLAFENSTFLEIIGPDENLPDTSLYKTLSELEPGELVPFHYAIRDQNAINKKNYLLPSMGYEPDHITMCGQDEIGEWTWDLVVLGGHQLGGVVPIMIQWGDSHHACESLPVVGRLESVSVTIPKGNSAHKLLDGVNGVDVREGRAKLEFAFTSNDGTHIFTSTSPKGISFPEETL